MKYLSRPIRRQILRYLVGAVSYFWIGYIVFAICYTGWHWDWFPAKMLSDGIGWTANYLIQRYWAFASNSLVHHERATIGRYSLLTIINLGIDYLIIWGLKAIGISPYIGFFISAGFFAAWNYLWYRFWVFMGKRSGDAKEVV